MSVTLQEPKTYSVTIWHTSEPGFAYEAHVYLDGVRVIIVGGMSVEEARVAARKWIDEDNAPCAKRTQVGAFTYSPSLKDTP